MQRENQEQARLRQDRIHETKRLKEASKQEGERLENAQNIEKERLKQEREIETVRLERSEAQSRRLERNSRREALGGRLSSAIDHISSTGDASASAGLIELGGLVDDWWLLGQEILADADTDGDRKYSVQEVNRRRQEIFDLIYKRDYFFVSSDGSSELQESSRKLIQQVRGSLFSSHVSEDDDSWTRLSLDSIQLDEVELRSVEMPHVRAPRAIFNGSIITDVRFGSDAEIDKLIDKNDIRSGEFSGECRLTRVSFRSTILYDCDFSSSRLAGVVFDNCSFGNVNFRDATLSRCSFRDMKWRRGSRFIMDFCGANLTAQKNVPTVSDVDSGKGFRILYDKKTVFFGSMTGESLGWTLKEDPPASDTVPGWVPAKPWTLS